MSEPNTSLHSVDLPEKCIGCPMIAIAGELYFKNVVEIEEIIQQRTLESQDRDLEDLASFHDMAVTAQKESYTRHYGSTMADVTQINAILEQSPGTADMPVLDFIRTYRTDDNRLGDDSVTQLLFAGLREGEINEELDEYISQLSIQKAVEIAISAAEAIMQRAEGPLDLSEECVQEALDALDTEKQHREFLAGTPEKLYVETVRHLLEQCPDGMVEVRTGLRKKNIARYCGSRALRPKKR